MPATLRMIVGWHNSRRCDGWFFTKDRTKRDARAMSKWFRCARSRVWVWRTIVLSGVEKGDNNASVTTCVTEWYMDDVSGDDVHLTSRHVFIFICFSSNTDIGSVARNTLQVTSCLLDQQAALLTSPDNQLGRSRTRRGDFKDCSLKSLCLVVRTTHNSDTLHLTVQFAS